MTTPDIFERIEKLESQLRRARWTARAALSLILAAGVVAWKPPDGAIDGESLRIGAKEGPAEIFSGLQDGQPCFGLRAADGVTKILFSIDKDGRPSMWMRPKDDSGPKISLRFKEDNVAEFSSIMDGDATGWFLRADDKGRVGLGLTAGRVTRVVLHASAESSSGLELRDTNAHVSGDLSATGEAVTLSFSTRRSDEWFRISRDSDGLPSLRLGSLRERSVVIRPKAGDQDLKVLDEKGQEVECWPSR